MQVELQPATPEDTTHLYAVFASTRADLDLVPLSEPAKSALLQQQFVAQTRHIALEYPAAQHYVVTVDARPAGRLVVDRAPTGWHVIDIALLPEFRSQGAGSALLAGLQAEAQAAGVPITLLVERGNPARRWYDRLGFATTAEHDTHLLLTWVAGAQPKTPS